MAGFVAQYAATRWRIMDHGSCMKSANITGISYSVGCAAGVFYLYETRGRAILKVFLKKV